MSHWQTDYVVLVLTITAADALETPGDRASTGMVLTFLIVCLDEQRKMTCRIKSDVNGYDIVSQWMGSLTAVFTLHFTCINIIFSIILKLHGVNDKQPFILQSQLHSCWKHGNSRSQGIGNNGIFLVICNVPYCVTNLSVSSFFMKSRKI